MPTINQLVKYPRIKKIHTVNVRALDKCPQKKAVCVKVRIVKPKKPNSAQRKIVKARLLSAKRNTSRRFVLAYIPGQGHALKNFSVVMVTGGRANDLPGVRYSLIRGLFDFS